MKFLLILLSSYLAYGQVYPGDPLDPSIDPSEITAAIAGRPSVDITCSENVDVFLQGGFTEQGWPRVSCPHEDASLVTLESVLGQLVDGQSVNIESGQSFLFSSNSIASPTAVIRRITVKSGGKLVFADRDFTLNIREIRVDAGGILLAGSETCRLYSKIHIVFHGTRADSENTGLNWPAGSKTTKGLLSEGRAEFHGKLYHPTWTRLARTGRAGDSIVFVGETTNWEVGQQVVLITSALHDCHSEYADHCRPCKSWQTCEPAPHQNEVRTIVATSMDCVSGERAIKLDSPLTYDHYAGPEYQTEVSLLTRRIKFSGSDSGDDFGGHTMVAKTTGLAKFSGVMGENMGQLNVITRYPFHLHLMNEAPTSYFKDCSVYNSNFRAFTIHGTNSSTIERNTAYNVQGFAYYLEDGVEEKNTFTNNLGAHIKPIKQAAIGSSQTGTVLMESNDLIIPADISASAFYIANAYNSYIGNVASGGWSGFAFPNLPEPIGQFKGIPLGNNAPSRRPTLMFKGNTAHSTGFYWKGAGSGLYVGARLRYVGNDLQYDSGRHSRTTTGSDNSKQWMHFEHFKVWAANTGIGHWGNRPQITRFEAHDTRRGVMLFGEASLVDGLINHRSGNQLAWQTLVDGGSTAHSYPTAFGFQSYDTSVKSLLSRVTFRGYNYSADGTPALSYLTHSDQFTPQGINMFNRIIFDNVDDAGRGPSIFNGHCGTDCGKDVDDESSLASRIASAWEADGSTSGRGKPTITGSNRDWWNADDNGLTCDYNTARKLWSCDWTENRHIAWIQGPWVDGLADQNGCRSLGAGERPCQGQSAFYNVGRMNQWRTADRGIDMGPWPSIAGMSNTGWHWRPRLSLDAVDAMTAPVEVVAGAPREWEIRSVQIPRGHFIVVSVNYPPTTTFEVRYLPLWWGGNADYEPIPEAANLGVVTSATEAINDPASITDCDFGETGGAPSWRHFCRTHGGAGGPGGAAWYFTGGTFYLRVVKFACYNSNTKDECDNAYRVDNVEIPSIMGAIGIRITATCTGCASNTHNGMQYFTVGDNRPTTPLVSPPGALRAMPTTPATTKNTCPASAATLVSSGHCFGAVRVTAAPTDAPPPTAQPLVTTGQSVISRCSPTVLMSVLIFVAPIVIAVL